eukprot:1719451-Prymnesium_polylepis.2
MFTIHVEACKFVRGEREFSGGGLVRAVLGACAPTPDRPVRADCGLRGPAGRRGEVVFWH